MRLHRLASLVGILALSMACSPANTSSSLDGTWKVTGLLCNGTTATGSIALGSQSILISIAGDTATTYTEATSGCFLTYPSAMSFPSEGKMTTNTPSGTYGCSPNGCNAACGSAFTGSGPYTVDYTVKGNTLTITEISGTQCASATPAQVDPRAMVWTRQ